MGESTRSSIRGARNGSPSRRATTTAGRSSRLVRARIARVVPSSGQDRTARSSRTVSSAASGARISRPDAAGPAPDRLGEPLVVVLDEPDRALDDRARTAVVDLEIDPPQTGQERLEPEDPTDIGQPPAVDRLVVVADEADVVRRGRQQQREVELQPVDVLRLVDQQRRRPRPPAGEQHRIGRETPDSPDHQVVEVDAARRLDRALVGDECAGDRPGFRVAGDLVGRHPEVQLEAREGEIEASTLRDADAAGKSDRSSSSRSISGSIATPASSRISRPSAWNVRTRTRPRRHSRAVRARRRAARSAPRPLAC